MQVGNVFDLLASVLSVIVFSISIKRIIDCNEQLKDNYSNIEKINLNWAKYFLLIGLIVAIGWMVVSFLNVYAGFLLKPLAIAVWVGVSVLIYWTAFSLLRKREVFQFSETNNAVCTATLNDAKIITLTHSDINTIEVNLQRAITHDKVFLDPKLTLRDLSKATYTTDKKLSTYINDVIDTSFYDFINQKRVQEFKDKIKEEDILNQLTILGMAKECGFNSKSSFYRAFKKHENMNPSAFLEALKQNKSH